MPFTKYPIIKKRSFTLIELTVAIGVLSLALTITGGVLLSVVRSFQKQADIQRVGRNGDLVLRLVEEKVRKATSVSYNSVTGQLKIVNPDKTIQYFGRILADPTPAICRNGYVYLTPDPFNTSETNKLTDNTSGGVDITFFTITANTSSSPQNVSVLINVTSPYQRSGANCTKKTISREFKTFISARGSY